MPDRPGIPSALAALAAILAALTPSPVLAQEPPIEEGVHPNRFELPPPPDEHPPILVGEVHVHVSIPVASGPLCPSAEVCVLRLGGGVGGTIARRWPNGLSLALGYDAFFLDGGGIWEIGVMQIVHAGVRAMFLRRSVLHPFIGGSAGALIFGDSFRVAAVGGGGMAMVGLEFELSAYLALTVASSWWLMTMTGFTTENDGVERGGGGVSLNTALQIGLTIFEGP